jgi:hypothetical protein
MSAAVSSPRTYSALAVLAFLALAACGGTGYNQPSSTTSQATSAATSAAGSTETGTGAGATGAVATAAEGSAVAGEDLTPDQEAELQQAVDQGHQPWRTDPAAVAEAFAASRYGWSGATATPTDAHTVEVTDPASGATASLQVDQPVRPGAGGIWVVVGGTRFG